MGFETRINVSTQDLPGLVRRLASVGCIVLDEGERITTDAGIGAEASLSVLFIDEGDFDSYALAGVQA